MTQVSIVEPTTIKQQYKHISVILPNLLVTHSQQTHDKTGKWCRFNIILFYVLCHIFATLSNFIRKILLPILL